MQDSGPAAKTINACSWTELLTHWFLSPFSVRTGLREPGLATSTLLCWTREYFLLPLRPHALLLLNAMFQLMEIISVSIAPSLLAQALSHVAVSVWNTYALLPASVFFHFCYRFLFAPNSLESGPFPPQNLSPNPQVCVRVAFLHQHVPSFPRSVAHTLGGSCLSSSKL